ncbi:MAG TPA: AAA family ATPase [Acidimicrobiales bacterium]|nr:AAA family ATPase [Acidimicrobiales bacterium]
MTLPDFVVISGAPGSGKTSLARRLADATGLPLFCKDTIKVALLDSLGFDGVEEAQRLGAASIAVLLAVAGEAGRGIVESAWLPELARDEVRRLPGSIVEVHCACEPAEAERRYRERERHPGHFDQHRAVGSSLWTGPRSQPIDGPWPVVSVDTNDHVPIELVVGLIGSSPG